MTRPVRDRGAALVLVLIVLTALAGLAHGALALARMHRRVAGTAAGAQSRQWMASALAVAEAGRALAVPGSTVVLDRLVPGGRARTTFRPLGPELALVEARVDSAGRGRAAGALLWALDPVARLEALPQAAATGASVGADSRSRMSTPPGETCLERPDTATLLGPLTLPALALGRLEGSELTSPLDALPGGTGTPEPVILDRACVPDAWNWGSPSDPDGPCGARFAAVFGAADLALDGGEGQGVVVVGGGLVLSGTRFDGLLLVGGDLRLLGGASVQGTARVGGRLTIDATSSWSADPCLAVRSLEAVRARWPARPLGRGGWPLR